MDQAGCFNTIYQNGSQPTQGYTVYKTYTYLRRPILSKLPFPPIVSIIQPGSNFNLAKSLSNLHQPHILVQYFDSVCFTFVHKTNGFSIWKGILWPHLI